MFTVLTWAVCRGEWIMLKNSPINYAVLHCSEYLLNILKNGPVMLVLNSLAHSQMLTVLGSVEHLGFFFLVPVCGGLLTHTFPLRMTSEYVGALNWLRVVGTEELKVESASGRP